MSLVRMLTLAFTLTALVPSAVQAQFTLEPGRVQLSGSASFSRTTAKVNENKADPEVRASVDPMVQYFVRYGLAVGGQTLLQYNSRGDNSLMTYGIGPGVSYYFGRGVQRLHPFIQGSLYYLRQDFEGAGGFTANSSQVGYQVAGGLLVLFSRNAGINSQLFYRADNADRGSDDISFRTLGLAIGISAFAF